MHDESKNLPLGVNWTCEVLVCKWPAVDRLSARSIALCEVCGKIKSILEVNGAIYLRPGS
jgi:hypothetical protein